ncbi:MAG: hypothetical protein AB1545_05350, partial [Thermodesulfobacteriota bacterium]
SAPRIVSPFFGTTHIKITCQWLHLTKWEQGVCSPFKLRVSYKIVQVPFGEADKKRFQEIFLKPFLK